MSQKSRPAVANLSGERDEIAALGMVKTGHRMIFRMRQPCFTNTIST